MDRRHVPGRGQMCSRLVVLAGGIEVASELEVAAPELETKVSGAGDVDRLLRVLSGDVDPPGHARREGGQTRHELWPTARDQLAVRDAVDEVGIDTGTKLVDAQSSGRL